MVDLRGTSWWILLMAALHRRGVFLSCRRTEPEARCAVLRLTDRRADWSSLRVAADGRGHCFVSTGVEQLLREREAARRRQRQYEKAYRSRSKKCAAGKALHQPSRGIPQCRGCPAALG